MAYQKQYLKQDIPTIKNSSTTKHTKIICIYQMNSGKLKLPKKNEFMCGRF